MRWKIWNKGIAGGEIISAGAKILKVVPSQSTSHKSKDGNRAV
jgi:hypothetical protein